MDLNKELYNVIDSQSNSCNELYLINNLKNMQVIDLNTGKVLGYINDLLIDCEEYKIQSIIIPIERKTWFKKGEVLEIPWNNIYKIGTDVILVNLKMENIGENINSIGIYYKSVEKDKIKC